MKVQVKMIRSSTSVYAGSYMSYNNLMFDPCKKPDRRRYDVLHGRSRSYIGELFAVGGIWCFVPFTRPDGEWYFGKTRCDAVGGYLQAIGQEVLPKRNSSAAPSKEVPDHG